MAKKDAVGSVDSVVSDGLEEVVEEASHTTGRTPREITVMVREFSKMLEAVRMSKVEEVFIGTYFIPYEGQLGIEGLVNAGAALINGTIRNGWQPWQMATPYPGKYSFRFPDGTSTGALDGQWLTIIFGRAPETLQ